jgi:ribosome biogenesis protein Tsr3
LEQKINEVTGGWKKLHNEELRGLKSSPSIIRKIKSRRMRWMGHIARMGDKRNAYGLLVRKPEGRRPLGRRRRRLVDNVGMHLLEISWGDANWIALAQNGHRWRAVVNSVWNLRVP